MHRVERPIRVFISAVHWAAIHSTAIAIWVGYHRGSRQTSSSQASLDVSVHRPWPTNSFSPLRSSSSNATVRILGISIVSQSCRSLDDSDSNHHHRKCDPCLKHPLSCTNNGTCRALSTEKYTCDCSLAFHGERCEKIIDACFDNPCQHRATCQGLANGQFRCLCSAGYTGERCEINIDDCISHSCENNGTCIDQVNEYTCACPPSFTGEFNRCWKRW